ncbi:MAG: HigA family addiction module antidote protein [Thermoguttaceae bacterium]|nr:HigA family addiction module antidote protein [Thermoguttaceae bacterium]
MNEQIQRIPPGEILLAEFMQPLGLSAWALAAKLNISEEDLNALTEGRSPLTEELARKLGNFFGTSAEFWMNLQKNEEAALVDE